VVTPLQSLLLGVSLAGVALLAYGGLQLQPALRIIGNDPVYIRALEHLRGPVEIAGTAGSDGTVVVAPFSGPECLACRYTVEEYRQAGKHAHWETLAEGGGGTPFLVDDGTGRVPVDPDGANLRLDAHTTRVEPGEEPPERIARYVAAPDVVDANDRTIDLRVLELNVGNEQRFTERRLDPGETVHVYGTVGRPGEAPEWGSDRVDAEIDHEPGAPHLGHQRAPDGLATRTVPARPRRGRRGDRPRPRGAPAGSRSGRSRRPTR